MVDELHRDPTFRVLGHQNVVFLVWCDAPTGEQAKTMGRVLRPFMRARRCETAMWNVILTGKPSFSEPVRRELATQLGDPTLQGLAIAHVVLVDGFAGAATRGFLGGITLLGRPKTPTKVFGDVPTAAAWLAPLIAGVPGAPDPREIARVHATLVDGMA